jgi:hypothetical protein
LVNDTITANNGGANPGGIFDPIGPGGSGTPVLLSNTLIAGNTTSNSNAANAAPDCQGRFGDGPGGHNLLGNDHNCTGLTNNTNGDHVGSSAAPIDPQLGPLALNGGSTQNAAPLAGSPAIGTAAAPTCQSAPVSNVDQRRRSRSAQTRGVCDVGAYDTGGAAPTAGSAGH